MTVQNARPCSFTQLTTDADWEMLVATYGLLSGVRGAPGSPYLTPSFDGATRSIDMAAGSAVIYGRLWSCDATVSTAIPAASGSDRIDRLVLRLDRTAGSAATVIQPVVIEGTPSANPAKPGLQRSLTGQFDIPIAHWNSKSSGVLNGLTDERNYTGTSIVSAPSTFLPTLLQPGLCIETDTGIIRLSRLAGTWDSIISRPPDSWHGATVKAGWGGKLKVSYVDTAQRLVHLASVGNLTAGTTDNGTTMASLPGGYWPAATMPFPVATDQNDQEGAHFHIQPNGDVQCWGIGNGTTIGVNVTYPLDLS